MDVTDRPLRIALPKGRITDDTLAAFVRAGLVDGSAPDPGRRLVVPLPGARERLGIDAHVLLLKNADVPTYVEHGIAEVGVCGTDVIDEAAPDVFEPFTFAFGRCRIAVAGRRGMQLDALDGRETVRVATKYTTIASRWIARRGWTADLIRLGGSVELAAVLGLADVIVDLVETGRTLDENNLEVLEVIGHTQVKLIANKSLTGARAEAVARLVAALEAVSRVPS
jgi:ATP phosphoribosyltransferase